MKWWYIYLLTRCDAINKLLTILSCIAFIALVLIVIGYIIWKVDLEDELESEISQQSITKFKRYTKAIIVLILLTELLQTIIPSTKEAIAIFAVPEVYSSEVVQQFYDNIVDMLNKRN